MKKKQYIPKVGDRVILRELHPRDAYAHTMEKVSGKVLIIDEISQHTDNLFPFAFAEVHEKVSGMGHVFFAARFISVPFLLRARGALKERYGKTV